MENPASRPPAAQLIDKVIEEYYNQRVMIGWSLAMRIYDALKRAGYLTDDE